MEIQVYKTQGIIIKKVEWLQTGRLLTIYTKKYGKILVRAKGIGKRESKLKSLIEPFNLCEFMLVKSKTIDVLAGVYPIREFIYLRNNLESLACAFYFAELIDKLVVAPERDEKVWALLARAMEVLDKYNSPHPSLNLREGANSSPSFLKRGMGGVNLSEVKTLFEQKLLEFLGYGLPQNKKALEVIQGLAGEEIRSENFLIQASKL